MINFYHIVIVIVIVIRMMFFINLLIHYCLIKIIVKLKQRFGICFDHFDFIQFINNDRNGSYNDSEEFFSIESKMRRLIELMKLEMEVDGDVGIVDYELDINDENDEKSEINNFEFLVNPQLFDIDNLNLSDSELVGDHDNTNDKNNNLAPVAPILIDNSNIGSKENSREKQPIMEKDNLLHEITINDLSWLLLKESFDDTNEMILRIDKTLMENTFAFLLLACKLYRKTNEELLSLLTFSFQRLQNVRKLQPK